MPALLRSNLGVVCPSCDFLNVVGAVKCMACSSVTDAPITAGRTDRHQAYPSEPAAAATVPPGLKRANTAPPIAAVPAQAAPAPQEAPAPKTPTGTPVRPTFQSSTAPVAAGPKFGLSVVAGPARGQRFRLGVNGAQVGRSKGVILFPEDPFVSPLHATLTLRDGKLHIRDDESTSGVYVSINGQETISADSYFATGLRLFHYIGALEPAPPFVPGRLQIYGAPVPANQVHYSVEEILLGGRPGRAVITAGPILTVGQSKCDLSFANEDGMAPRHCELSPMPTGAMIRDLSGGLGTFVKVSGERQLKAGDRMRVGQQTLQVELLS
jgi:pSer/pThr/pTyr-binding forkhead associated (FHA) protein